MPFAYPASATLRSSVVGYARERHVGAEKGADEHDPATVAHSGRRRTRVGDRTQDVDLPLAIVFVAIKRGIVDELTLDCDAGIVHEDVQLAEFGDHRVDQRLGGRQVGLIALDRDRARNAFAFSFAMTASALPAEAA
jgi:hypothetical protein